MVSKICLALLPLFLLASLLPLCHSMLQNPAGKSIISHHRTPPLSGNISNTGGAARANANGSASSNSVNFPRVDAMQGVSSQRGGAGPIKALHDGQQGSSNNEHEYHVGNDVVSVRVGMPKNASQILHIYRDTVARAQDGRLTDGTLDDPMGKLKQLEGDLAASRVQAVFVERGPRRELQACALFNYVANSRPGKEGEVMYVKNFYIMPDLDPEQDAKRAENILLRELAKIAKFHGGVTHIKFVVSRRDSKATFDRIYNRMSDQLTQMVKPTGQTKWRLPSEKFQQIEEKYKAIERGNKYSAEWESQIYPYYSKLLTERINQFLVQTGEESIDEPAVAKLLSEGKLHAINISSNREEGMALFSTKAYTLWKGQFIWLDRVIMPRMHMSKAMPKVMPAVFAELVKVARQMEPNAASIEWNWTDDDSQRGTENGTSATEVFELLGAINSAKQDEQLLTYEWDYNKFLLLEKDE